MELMDIPIELLGNILKFAILARGISRGVRLRLVSSKAHDNVTNYNALTSHRNLCTRSNAGFV